MWDKQELRELGISDSAVISPRDILFYEEIRKICEGNVCRRYGTTWACPPAVGTVTECRERCMRFEHAMVFNAVYRLEDSLDFEGMRRGHKEFKDVCDRLYERVKGELGEFLLLSNESCMRCKSCTYPYDGCRFPEKLFPSLEGFGIQVSELAEKAGLKYMNGIGTVTYFGMLLY